MHAPIEIDEATIGYAGRDVLRNVCLKIEHGERIALLGRSGAGKSTLINYLYGLCGEDAALVPQAAALVRNLSVFHNVYMGRLDRNSIWRNLRMLALPAESEKAEITEVLGSVGLADKMFEKAGRLSGGQQQRASVARAIYNGRPIVLGDEPLSALDRLQGEQILRDLVERAQTLVLAMHDVPLALAYATRVIVIDKGAIALDASTGDLRQSDIDAHYGQAA